MAIWKWLARGIALTGAVTVGISGTTLPAWAQAVPITRIPSTSEGVPRQRTPNGGRDLPPQITLASLLDKLEWNAAARGPLLVVSPDETVAVNELPVRDANGTLVTKQHAPMPPVDADGGFALAGINDYFSRKLVGVHTLSVLAPTTMTVLSDHRLPKPDPYIGMSTSEKSRLLEASFTEDQWQRAGSAEGIGVSDMTREQRELYLSMLPDPFVIRPYTVMPTENGFSHDPAGDMVTLTPSQREGIHLSLQKQLDWTFRTGQNGNGTLHVGGVGLRDVPTGTVPAYVLQMSPGMLGFNMGSVAFGTALTEQVPSRPKTSQLPENAPGLELSIALGDDATLGDLVQRVAQKTGLELYADPRYSGRKLYVRVQAGQSCQSGDVLRALALAVTGTWRHVGTAYVLTDDIEGLGVRHARISDWLSQNKLLAQARDEEADRKLADVPFDRVTHWSDSDPLHPDSALAAKLDASQKPGADSQALFVPINELPASVQTIVNSQIKEQQAAQERMATQFTRVNGGNLAREPMIIHSDGVNLTTKTTPMYVVPGMANVPAQDIQSAANSGAFSLNRMFQGQNIPAAVEDEPVTTLAFPENCPVHVVLIAPRSEADVTQAIQAASQHGFQQVWVQTPRGETALLESAVRQGTAKGLTVQAVVRPLQAIAADPADTHDRDVLGDTTLEYARHKQGEIRQLGIPEAVPETTMRPQLVGSRDSDASDWRSAVAVASLMTKGDYLRSDDTGVQTRITADLTRIAALPGLGGLVLRDIVPPGYIPIDPSNVYTTISGAFGVNPTVNDPLLQLGYTESLRLACLRKNGFDPIDLSPLRGGDRIDGLPGSSMMGMHSASIALPFFRDLGTSFGGSVRMRIVNGVPTPAAPDKSGMGESLSHWSEVRVAANHAGIAKITTALHAANPKVNLMSSIEGRSTPGNGFWFGSIDDASNPTTVTTSTTVAPPVAPAPPDANGRTRTMRFVQDAVKAKAESKTAFRALTAAPAADNSAESAAFQLRNLQYGLRNAMSWDGVVVDLSEVPMPQALHVMQAFSAVK